MEKYAVQDEDLLNGLRNEEHQLMLQISHLMSGQKTAAEDSHFQQIQNRLQILRDKITSLDLKNKSSEF